MSSISSSVFRDALKSGLYADFCIRCQQHQFSVHKLVLCSASSWFTTICSSTFKENNENLVDLPDHDPATVARVLMYLYTSDYSLPVKAQDFNLQKETDNSTSVESAGNPEAGSDSQYTQLPCDPSPDTMTKLKVHTLVYKAADFLDIPGLKKHALEKFSSDFNSEILSSPALRELVTLVYESTPADDKFRNFFSDKIISNHAIVSEDQTAVGVMRHFEPVAWVLGSRNHTELSTAASVKSDLDAKLLESTLKVETLTSQVQELTKSQARAQDELNEYLDRERSKPGVLQNSALVKFCPHCGKEMYLVVKKVTSGGYNIGNKFETKCLTCSKTWVFEAQ